jgi:hypothetical protein
MEGSWKEHWVWRWLVVVALGDRHVVKGEERKGKQSWECGHYVFVAVGGDVTPIFWPPKGPERPHIETTVDGDSALNSTTERQSSFSLQMGLLGCW